MHSTVELDAAHFLHPFTNHKSLRNKGTRVITRGEGVYIYDDKGKRILDGMSGLWCVNLGYGRQELVEAARKQMEILPYYNSFFQCTTEPTIALAAEIASIAPKGMNQVFFTGSGSEANDTVVRMARHYWALQGKASKQVIISRHNAYHGSTMAGASLGGMKFMHAQGGLPIPGIVHIDQPYWFGEGAELTPEAFGIQAAKALEEKILELGEDQVAAFIAEPVQGAGGVIIPPSTYWPEIKKVLAKYDVLLVVDEVICGFGRLGEWFGSQHFELLPDLMPIAKGLSSGYLPIGGVVVSDRVSDVICSHNGEFAHGYTYSGHPVAAAVALENLRILQEEQIVTKVKYEKAPYLQKRWACLAEHPLVGEARSKGLMAALELVKDKQTRERVPGNGATGELCRDICIENGIVMRAVGDTMIVAPPLVIGTGEIDELVDNAWKSLDETERQLRHKGML